MEENKTLDDRVNEIFEEIGGGNLFQVFAYIALAFGVSAPSFFVYEVGYLTQAPDLFICTYVDGYVPPPGVDICT